MRTKRLAVPYLIWMVIFTIIPLGIVVFFAFADSVSHSFTLANIIRIGNYMPVFIN